MTKKEKKELAMKLKAEIEAKKLKPEHEPMSKEHIGTKQPQTATTSKGAKSERRLPIWNEIQAT